MSVSTLPAEHAVLHGIRWQTYERLLHELQDRRLRLTFDRGTLEIMSPSNRHEAVKRRIGRLIEAMTEVLGVAIRSGGSTTWRRQDLERGLEPDECYWVQNEPAVRDLDGEIDLREHPPPDLSVEVDVHASLDRMAIYGALGVPEVWRWDQGRIQVSLRQPDGSYATSFRSACFPWLPLAAFEGWLRRTKGQSETDWIRAFRAWVRATITVR